MLLGGVPNLPENFPVSHKDFIGCMRDLHIDGRRMDMAAFVANNGTMAGRPCPHYREGVVPWTATWYDSKSDLAPPFPLMASTVWPLGPTSYQVHP